MKGAIWGFFALLAALWSGLAWLAHGLAGSGSAAVVTVSKWLGIDPSQTQWLADGLASAGWLAQGIVLLLWLMGMGLLGLFGWMGSRAASGMDELGEELRRDARVRGQGPVVEGEVAQRRMDPAPAGDQRRMDPAPAGAQRRMDPAPAGAQRRMDPAPAGAQRRMDPAPAGDQRRKGPARDNGPRLG